MSRIHAAIDATAAATRTLFVTTAIAGISLATAGQLGAQTALGTPFIKANNLSFYTSDLTRSGGPEMTRTFGLVYGHEFGRAEDAQHLTMVVRGAARAFDDVQAGVLDLGATIGVSHQVTALPGLSVAASTGLGLMAWGDDSLNTGRLHLTIPANVGASYDIRVRGATFSPFVSGTVNRYDLRTSVDDERDTVRNGWDANYAMGASLRLKEVVVTSSRIIGEYGMPNHSRWALSAGLSF